MKDANIYKMVAGYGLVTEAKVRRAEAAAKGDEELTLALYASYGGLIVDKNYNPVENEKFFDFKTKQPVKAKKEVKKEEVKEEKKEEVKKEVKAKKNEKKA